MWRSGIALTGVNYLFFEFLVWLIIYLYFLKGRQSGERGYRGIWRRRFLPLRLGGFKEGGFYGGLNKEAEFYGGGKMSFPGAVG